MDSVKDTPYGVGFPIRTSWDQSSPETKESKTKYEALNLSEKAKESEKKKKDPEITKLEEFLSKRLSESLYGDIASAQSQTGSTKIVDHKVFYELTHSATHLAYRDGETDRKSVV